MNIDEVEKEMKRLESEYQCLISKDRHGNYIRLTCAYEGIFFIRTEKGWKILRHKKPDELVPYRKGEENENKKILKDYKEALYKQVGLRN